MILRLIFLLLVLIVTGCCPSHLSVQTQYITREDLASFYVGTPDPRLDLSLIEQRLLIQWCLPNQEMGGESIELRTKIRFKNHVERSFKKEIFLKWGKYSRGYELIRISDEEYEETGGIMTYIVEILKNGEVIDTWKHPLWVELITI